MLKIGKVYQYEDRFYYVESKRKYKRILYRLRRVLVDGALAEVIETHFKRGKFFIVEKAVAYVKVSLPHVVKQEMIYKALVREAKSVLLEYANPDKRRPQCNYVRQIARFAFASIGHYDAKKKRTVDIRIFAKDIGLKSAVKLYNCIAESYKEDSPNTKYTSKLTGIPSLSDGALISSYQQMNGMWKYVHGYSKKLDHYLERDLKGYIDELKVRNIDMASITPDVR